MLIFFGYLLGLVINSVGLKKSNPMLTWSQSTAISLLYPISGFIAIYSFITARLLGVGMSVVCFVDSGDLDPQKNDDLSL